jgi:LuxR family transcriptional regulator, maltose regulon positive regulatory protein
MVEPPATTSSAAATAAPDALLASKLHLPRTRPGFVARARLADRLAQAYEGELTLVCAPAGFGKTALLADWARRSQRPVAWLSLDEGDNDPVRFWRHVAAALDRVRAGVGERVAGLLRPPPRSFEAVVTALVNELATQPNEVALVLDDYHLVHAPPVHGSVEFLLEHLPPSLCLVLAGRADPPLPLARLRARGQLTEVRAGDLRFTPEEAAELLRSAVGPDLPEATVAALEDRTEGWVAGLQLAALSLRGRTDIAGFLQSFSGSHRYVLDYLTEEVLDRQPEPLRGFLLETSILERLSGPLCAAVTGRADSQQLLEQVERANLFLLPLDEVRGWWRYHQLFADLLRARLAREQPERLPALHRAAAAWSEEHGLVDDAVRHALAVNDHESVLRVVEQHITAAMARSEGATLNRWHTALPIEVVRSRPRLCLLQAYRAVGDGQPGPLQRWLDDAERAVAAGRDAATAALSEPAPAGWAAGWLTNVPGSLAVLRAELARLRGEPHRTIELARQALARLPAGRHILRSLADWNLARGYWLAGELTEAERALDAIVAERRAAGEHYLALIACWDLGRVQAAKGRLRAAAATYRGALGLGAEAGPGAHPALGIAHVGLAEVLCEQDELEAALDQVTEGVQRCRQLANSLPLSAGLATLARIRQARGDRPSAMAAITEAGEVGPSPEVVDLFNPVPVQRARLLLADGEVDQAARWVATRGLDAEEEPSYVHERELLVLARVLLAQQRPEQARRLLARMGGAAQAQGRTGSLIEVRTLEALALDMAGEPAWALAALTQALSLACPEGYVRVFADEGPPMAALLRRLVAAGRQGAPAAAGQVPLDYLGRLLRAVEQQHKRALPASRQATMPGLVEALTARELEVLALLAAGKPNQQIAEELVVTLDTVKKHITHILDKLGAANRMQAVAHARKLGMLP